MNFARVWAVIDRELTEVRKNRTLLIAIFFPPLILTFLPLGVMALMGTAPERSNTTGEDIRRYMEVFPELAGMSSIEVVQVVLMRQFLVMYLMLPVIIPTAIATASIIGEKESRSLEPLLATPIRTEELLAAKSIAALAPAILTTWFAYVVFFVGARFVALSDRVFAQLLSPLWILAILLLSPLLSLLSISLSVLISSRVNDARVAQQVAGLLVLPVIALAVGQTLGLVFLNYVTFAVAVFILCLVNIGVLYAGVQLFQREQILTRWK